MRIPNDEQGIILLIFEEFLKIIAIFFISLEILLLVP